MALRFQFEKECARPLLHGKGVGSVYAERGKQDFTHDRITRLLLERAEFAAAPTPSAEFVE